ncbi:MAG: MarR family winged helix-turn-helix transcriptional regulator [Acidimicrobiales bacterium]
MTTSPPVTRAQHSVDGDAALAARLRLAVMRLARRLRQESTGDVTASQISALATLDRQGPMSLGELSTAERVQPPSMTRIVGGLEQLGLVLRTPDAHDRRVAHVALTPEGSRLVLRSSRRKDAYLAARLRELEPDDRNLLAAAAPLLERLLAGDSIRSGATRSMPR